MNEEKASAYIIELLNQALARELQVSVQYMLQHAVGASQGLTGSTMPSSDKLDKFVSSHSPYFLPGTTLKKIAITEMRHAEAISERIVNLGGKPTTQPAKITLDMNAIAMLENDREQERSAIELYKTIITSAEKEHDEKTTALFKSILKEEESHHRMFSELLV
jgi:bacterioferritin